MVDAASEMTADEENRVSRILATPGLDRAAIVRLQRQTVLIAGLNGLGVASMSGLASSLFCFPCLRAWDLGAWHSPVASRAIRW
jgi:hypothetical protein